MQLRYGYISIQYGAEDILVYNEELRYGYTRIQYGAEDILLYSTELRIY